MAVLSDSQENMSALMAEADKNGDGIIEYEEFLDAWYSQTQAEQVAKATQSSAPTVAGAAAATAASTSKESCSVC